MKYIILLIILTLIYYQIYRRAPDFLSMKNHICFFIFIILYTSFYYLMNYQRGFIYNIVKTIKDIDEHPLYDKNSMIFKQNQMEGLKYNLAMRQGWRCIHCQNPILQKDIYNYKIHYIKPLEFGGGNDIHNIGIKCNVCSSFSPY